MPHGGGSALALGDAACIMQADMRAGICKSQDVKVCGSSLPKILLRIGLFHVACFLVFARLIERWALGEVLALSAMAGCSQRVELCAAYALRMQGRWDV